MRTIADKSLIVISLETYSLVSRLLEHSFRSSKTGLQTGGIDIEVSRSDTTSLYLNFQSDHITYNFSFPANGWLTITENIDGTKTERFNMGFYRDDHNFSFTGERLFCIEICTNLIRNIKEGFDIQ